MYLVCMFREGCPVNWYCAWIPFCIVDVLVISVICSGFNLYLLGKYKKYSRELSNIFYGWMDRQYLLGKCLLFSQNVGVQIESYLEQLKV